jgi:hypothetical protein
VRAPPPPPLCPFPCVAYAVHLLPGAQAEYGWFSTVKISDKGVRARRVKGNSLPRLAHKRYANEDHVRRFTLRHVWNGMGKSPNHCVNIASMVDHTTYGRSQRRSIRIQHLLSDIHSEVLLNDSASSKKKPANNNITTRMLTPALRG